MIPIDILSAQTNRVRNSFNKWTELYTQRLVLFQRHSLIHGEAHSERVLLHALRIADAMQLDDLAMEQLAHAAIFHDTRRQDDLLDIGHGARAAQHYKDFCEKHGEIISFHPQAYFAMAFHDQDDELGLDAIAHAGGDSKWTTVYQIFKDADALDRYRLGPWGLNENFLRNKTSLAMTDFAKDLLIHTIEPKVLTKTMIVSATFIRQKYGGLLYRV